MRERVVAIELEIWRANIFSNVLFVAGIAALLGATAGFSLGGLQIALTPRVGEFLIAVAITSSLYAATLNFISSSLSACLKATVDHQKLPALERALYLSTTDLSFELLESAEHLSMPFLRSVLVVAFFSLVYVLALMLAQFGLIAFAVWELFVHEKADWISITIGMYGSIGALLPLAIHMLADIVSFSYPLRKDVERLSEQPTADARLKLKQAMLKQEARYFALFIRIASKRALRDGRL